MAEEFVNYNQALKLKELGFDEPCLMYIDDEEDLINDNTAEWIGAIKCPLKSQAFRWFREKKLADGSVSRHGEADGGYSYRWDIVYEYGVYEERHFKKGYNTYEEAELACLDKLIEIVESKSE